MLYPTELREQERRNSSRKRGLFSDAGGSVAGGLPAPGYARAMSMPRLAVAVLFAVVALVAGTTVSEVEQDDPLGFEVIVLGRAQDGGLPHLGCERGCCVEARRSGRVETPACLGIRDLQSGKLLLVEATPAIEKQVGLLHEFTKTTDRGRSPVDGILLTHAHIGHYAGLIQLGREVASTPATPVWSTPRLAGFLRTNGPWSQLVDLKQIDLREIAPGSTDGTVKAVEFQPLPGLVVEAIRVPHRDEFSDTVAYKFKGPNGTVLFCPDVDRWEAHEGLLDALLEGVDVAYLDATFYDGRELPGRNILEIPHPPMVRTMELLETEGVETPGRIRFIHLNHTNPALNRDDLQAEIRDRGFPVAEVGERVVI